MVTAVVIMLLVLLLMREMLAHDVTFLPNIFKVAAIFRVTVGHHRVGQFTSIH